MKDKDVLHLLRQQDKTMFPPGSVFHYSNTGYAFLALVVQAASGKTFAEFLRENIFQPLGMAAPWRLKPAFRPCPIVHWVTARLSMAIRSAAFFRMTDQSLTSAVLGDGGIYSSTADLFKWDQALYTEKLVSRVMLQKALTVESKTSDFAGSGYGYWLVEVGSQKGVPCVWHYGNGCGFSTHIERYRKRS